MKEIISILSGTFDFDDLVEEIVEAVEADDLLEVDTMSENWSQLFLSQVMYELFVKMQICVNCVNQSDRQQLILT